MTYTVDDVDRVMDGDFEIPSGYGDYKYTSDDYSSMWSLFKYEEINDVPTELGVISRVDSYGGEGQGDEYWVVVKITNGDDVRFFRKDGWYQSYSGGELDGDTREVKPAERVVTFYE